MKFCAMIDLLLTDLTPNIDEYELIITRRYCLYSNLWFRKLLQPKKLNEPNANKST